MMNTPIFQNGSLQAQFEADGYIRLPFLTGEAISGLLDSFDRLSGGMKVESFHATMHHADPEYRKAVDEAIRKVAANGVADLLAGYRILFANFIFKPSGPDTQVGIHQDWSYVDEDRFTSLNIWIPLVDTELENGPVFVLPGSQRIRGILRYTPFEGELYEAHKDWIHANSRMLSLKAGEALIYDSRLIHYSTPNLSGKMRPAIGFVNIPKAASPLHFCKVAGSESLVEGFEVNDRFFYEFRIGSRPRNQLSSGYFSHKNILTQEMLTEVCLNPTGSPKNTAPAK